MATDTEILILQHPLETGHPKGSAQLLHLSLANSRRWVGETYPAAELAARLAAGGRRSVLLYPADGPYPCSTVSAAQLQPRQTRLVVLDGTWRKTRKQLHLNPPLQQLPRLVLTTLGEARYSIRKAQRPQQRSTLEATCQALAEMERCKARLAPILNGFAALNRRFAAHGKAPAP